MSKADRIAIRFNRRRNRYVALRRLSLVVTRCKHQVKYDEPLSTA